MMPAPTAEAGFDLEAYDYHLPDDQIAQHPPARRHDARLLTLGRCDGAIELGAIPDLVAQVGAGDCVVRNVAQVDPARLVGTKAGTGGRVEALLLRRLGGGRVEAMMRPGRRLREGVQVEFGGVAARVTGRVPGGAFLLEFDQPDGPERAMDAVGQVPLPPYVEPAGQDPARYQTTYARARGSAAAPTAGFHFEAADFEAWRARGATIVDVVLDVGAGTFRPVSAPDIRDHVMHREDFRISPEDAATLAAARREGRRVIALGTTSLRVLESLPANPGWEEGVEASTDLYLQPGHRFTMADALVTNFHLPKSSLLILVCAFAGYRPVMEAYARARDEGFRFFSFGDAMWVRP